MSALSHISDFSAWITVKLEAYLSAQLSLRDHVEVALLLAIAIGLEIAAHRNVRLRYGSHNFRIDVLYYVFYYCGPYQILFFVWLYKLLTALVVAFAPWLQLNLLGSMHPALQIAVIIIVFDFVGYWSHRWRHSHRYLWAFHSIHHSQTKMTPITNYRFHFVDETLLRLWVFIPFQILGHGIEMWIALHFIGNAILLFQHSEWDWTYGPLGRIFVSPAFHRIHHATEPELHNSNYGMLFTFWDDLFGTAERQAAPPARHGIAGDPVPESFWRQFAYPFLTIWRDFRPPARPARVASPTATFAE